MIKLTIEEMNLLSIYHEGSKHRCTRGTNKIKKKC